MRYVVIDRGDDHSKQLSERFHTLAAAQGFTLDEHQPDIVISIGGDGTLLEAFHKYNHQLDQVSFIGVHTGHLGFYADWQAHELDTLVHENGGRRAAVRPLSAGRSRVEHAATAATGTWR